MPIITGPAGSGELGTAPNNNVAQQQSAQAVNAGKGSSTSNSYVIYNNPAFDQRITSLSYPMQGGASGQQLARGFMVWALKTNHWGGNGGPLPTLAFLYNPTTVTAYFATDVNDTSVDMLYSSPPDSGLPTMGMNQVVSFSLLFDRTFEMWGSYSNSGEPNTAQSGLQGSNDPSVVGVDADVLAMKQLAGMFFFSASQRGTAQQQIAQGPMLMIPTYLNFGKLSSGETYYGYVSDFTVTYTHWTQNMVPIRCTIDVDFTLLIPPALSGASSSAQGNIALVNSVVQQASNGWTTTQLGSVGVVGVPTGGNTGTAGR
jgi:hypothetical protein